MNAECIRDVVVLDVDDTLYLERDYVASGFRAVGRQIADQFGVRDFADRALDFFNTGARTRIFDAVLEEQGIPSSPDVIARLLTIYRSHEPDITLADDAASFIARPRATRALAIISDGFLVAQQAKIRALGVDRGGIARIILTDEFGRSHWKPHVHAFRLMQEHFGLPPDRFIYVADNPAKDFVAPHALGWKTARMRRGGGLHDAMPSDPRTDVELKYLDQLAEPMLDLLLGR